MQLAQLVAQLEARKQELEQQLQALLVEKEELLQEIKHLEQQLVHIQQLVKSVSRPSKKPSKHVHEERVGSGEENNATKTIMEAASKLSGSQEKISTQSPARTNAPPQPVPPPPSPGLGGPMVSTAATNRIVLGRLMW